MRGKLPRSYKFSPTDPQYSTDEKTNAYLYDAALAVIGTVGVKAYSLAYEIVNGLVTSQFASGSVPNVANHLDASGEETYLQADTVALVAYALGFYLESYPSTQQYCEIVRTIRECLHWLELHRDNVYKNGLINVGTNSDGTENKTATATDNVLAYFAFKQAGRVLNEQPYINASLVVQSGITDKLWANNVLSGAIDATGDALTAGNLDTLAMGALFFIEMGNKPAALTLLNQTEAFKTIDSANGCSGYKVSTAGANKVWFEGSFAVALAYYKYGNMNKYNAIVNELNRFKDDSDGGYIGDAKNDTYDTDLLGFKGVGATAWALIANNVKAVAFTTRILPTPVITCPVPYFNVLTSDFFTKECDSGFNGTSEEYLVQAGRYISYVDQATANAFATADVTAKGQNFANVVGSCSGQVGNDAQSGTFYNSTCPNFTTAQPYIYTVPANTVFAATKSTANAIAQAKVADEGQAAADANGECQLGSLSIGLMATSRVESDVWYDNIYFTIWADAPVTDTIMVRARARDASDQLWLIPNVIIDEGEISSTEAWAGQWPTGQGASIEIEIFQVTPSPDSVGTSYSY